MRSRTRPLGTVCALAPFDLDADAREPVPGDLIVSEAGSGYLVRDVHRVNSRVHPRRYRLTCVRVDPSDYPDIEHSHTLRWYPRG